MRLTLPTSRLHTRGGGGFSVGASKLWIAPPGDKPISATPQELSALDLISFDELQSDEIDESMEALSEGATGGTANDTDANPSEESSSKVLEQTRGKNSAPRHALNIDEKLLKVDTPSDSSRNVSRVHRRSKVGGVERRNMTEKDEDIASLLGQRRGRGARSAETWSEFGQEDIGGDAVSGDPEEFQLTHSTFALTGDTAHNQAMVHWSGQNSSVILMLTKYYDFNTGRVTESSLWRSTDYGTTYEKLNERVGLKTILSYLYVSPNNKRKIMLLTDPEVENSLLISLDEGASYQKHSLTFDILSLLFHPEQEDWILAYSHDQKLYVSVEFGRRWQLVHDNVVPNRFYW
uniref:Sortilin N-terminal domain-containing protein n=1 Tax=Knipowitschia caucasica TaxID=637954 RepID=A0AAV2JJ73_KNICA